jgi:hypothetical protein
MMNALKGGLISLPIGIYKISRESWVRETSQQKNATV